MKKNWETEDDKDIIALEPELEIQQQAVYSLLTQLQGCLSIYSRCLLPEFLNHDNVHEFLEIWVLANHRRARIQILVEEAREVTLQNHRLLTLGQRLPSFFEFRQTTERQARMVNQYLLIDNQGIFYQPHIDTNQYSIAFEHPRWAKELQHQFDALWQDAQPSPYLRQLCL